MKRHLAPLAALGLLAGGALAERWLDPRRLDLATTRAGERFVVTSGGDAGPGTLREALFAAARAETRATVILRRERIAIRTPLPALVNPRGVVLISDHAACELDASELVDGPVLDVATPGCRLEGLRIVGAPEEAVRVRAGGTVLREMTLEGCRVGVRALEGSGDLDIADSSFQGNGTGVHARRSGGLTSIRNNRFEGHGVAAVWIRGRASDEGSEEEVRILDNRFVGDATGIVVVQAVGLVSGNEIARSEEVGLHVVAASGSATRNRIHSGRGSGIVADGTAGLEIVANELAHNRAVGALLRSARSTIVKDNRIHANGYGVATLFDEGATANVVSGNLVFDQLADGIYVVGGAPLIRRNRLIGNRSAALRLIDYVDELGERHRASPLLRDNVKEGNGWDTPVSQIVRAERSAG